MNGDTRRNLKASQKAIAAAEAWDQLVIAKNGNKRADVDRHVVLAGMFGIGKSYVQMARAVLADDPIAAARVRRS